MEVKTVNCQCCGTPMEEQHGDQDVSEDIWLVCPKRRLDEGRSDHSLMLYCKEDKTLM